MEFDRQNQELEKVKDSNDDEIKPNALVQDETEILEKGLEAQEESLQTEKVEETQPIKEDKPEVNKIDDDDEYNKVKKRFNKNNEAKKVALTEKPEEEPLEEVELTEEEQEQARIMQSMMKNLNNKKEDNTPGLDFF